MYKNYSLIKDVAEIQTGRVAQPEKSGEVVYLQSRDFNDDGSLKKALLPTLAFGDVKKEHLLRPGDVLLSAKGEKNFSCVFEEHNPPAIASTTFLILRPNVEMLTPDYLVWFLSLGSSLAKLKAQSKGTAISSISKGDLGLVEIPIPPLSMQESIVKIAKLRKLEKSIKTQLEQLRQSYIDELLTKAISK